jgi:predicted flap endonuclease-1-like 5' DNA nuclease
MSGAAVVFTIAFLIPLGVTLGFPAFPPGEILYNLLGSPEIALSIGGISGSTIINGIINGLFWGAIAVGIYLLAHRASEPETLPPMPAPPHIPSPVPAPVPQASTTTVRRQHTHALRVRKTFVPLDQDIEAIEGIGPTYGTRLRNVGVKTVKDLLRTGASRSGRRYLANKIDVAPATLLKWVYRADFFRIKGIGKQYSSLLESAGVNTVADLAMRDPESLCERLRMINRRKNLVRRTPPSKMIAAWVRSAKYLKRIVM